MKITVEKKVFEEIELPMYFEKNGRYYKILNETYYMSVNPENLDDALDLVPNISVKPINHYLTFGEITPITKENFYLEFLRTEKILNDLRKL